MRRHHVTASPDGGIRLAFWTGLKIIATSQVVEHHRVGQLDHQEAARPIVQNQAIILAQM